MADKEPLDYTPADVPFETGDHVVARPLGWDGRYDDGTERATTADEAGVDELDGYLTVVEVGIGGGSYWAFSIRGIPIDPGTLRAA